MKIDFLMQGAHVTFQLFASLYYAGTILLVVEGFIHLDLHTASKYHEVINYNIIGIIVMSCYIDYYHSHI